ncbi:MAG: hypothetical protein BroJett003_06340 [Planctomycetota bacterium]|nr:MAG: hypothetical protein BroJett003_06340 [Planctomycetota bacterium]
MKKDEVKIGGVYTAKVSDRIVQVRIDSTNSHGGWNATNTATGKRIRIKSAQRLRRAVGGNRKTKITTADAREAVEAVVANDGPAVDAAATATAKAKPGKKARARKPAAGEPKPKRVSALDAAAEVLKTEGKSMRAKDLIDAMAAQGLWSSPNGKTPEATLYAAMLREARQRGDAARFRKADRGLFEFNAAAAEA